MAKVLGVQQSGWREIVWKKSLEYSQRHGARWWYFKDLIYHCKKPSSERRTPGALCPAIGAVRCGNMTWTGSVLLFYDAQAGKKGGAEISPALGRELYSTRISSPSWNLQCFRTARELDSTPLRGSRFGQLHSLFCQDLTGVSSASNLRTASFQGARQRCTLHSSLVTTYLKQVLREVHCRNIPYRQRNLSSSPTQKPCC